MTQEGARKTISEEKKGKTPSERASERGDGAKEKRT